MPPPAKQTMPAKCTCQLARSLTCRNLAVLKTVPSQFAVECPIRSVERQADSRLPNMIWHREMTIHGIQCTKTYTFTAKLRSRAFQKLMFLYILMATKKFN